MLPKIKLGLEERQESQSLCQKGQGSKSKSSILEKVRNDLKEVQVQLRTIQLLLQVPQE